MNIALFYCSAPFSTAGHRNRGAAIEKNALFYCGTLLLRRPAVEKGAPQLERFYTVPKLWCMYDGRY